jgi:hypothetical protein
VKDLATLLQAIAALLWPLVALAALLMFRTQVRDLLGRLRKGKLLGQEIELGESLARLNASATEAAADAAALPPPKQLDAEPPEPAVPEDDAAEETDAVIARVLTEAARSPKVGLLLLGAEIDRAVRDVSTGLGLTDNRRPLPLQRASEILAQRGALPTSLLEAVQQFNSLRSRLVHGVDADPNDVLKAIDSGVLILQTLRSVPYSIHRVYQTGIQLFSDPDCKTPREGWRLLVLENEAKPGRSRKSMSMHPTTRSHFGPGRAVAWQWNLELVISDSWYRDPETNQIKYASWSSSAEFIGKHLD